MTLINKDKNYSDDTVFETILYHENIGITRVFLWMKDPDQGKVTQKDRIQIRNRI